MLTVCWVRQHGDYSTMWEGLCGTELWRQRETHPHQNAQQGAGAQETLATRAGNQRGSLKNEK